MSETQHAEKRPNNNFERIVSFSARLQEAWEKAEKGEKKDRLAKLLREVNSVFESIEMTDQVPNGSRSLDQIISDGEQLIQS